MSNEYIKENDKFKILLVDDEKEYLEVIKMILESKKYLVDTSNSGKEALKKLNDEYYDLVISDLIMPEMTGMEVLEAIKEKHTETQVIIFTGYGTVETAVEAMKKGAFSYFIKSHNPAELLVEIDKVKKLNAYMIRSSQLEQEFIMESKSEAFLQMLNTIQKAAKSDVNILLLGESGVGKEIIANYIHQVSERSQEAFVPVNCHAFSESLLESELFGHEKGAFTGANESRIGRFEAANGGTLFLDEIGDTPLDTQVKLLRALESRQIERIGSNESRIVDFRLIAATNRDLHKNISEGAFREDLFYRISTIAVEIPPLRERKEDLPLLIQFFFSKFKNALNKDIKGIDEEVIHHLMQYDYPGNLRELRNIVERLVVLADKDVISEEDLPKNIHRISSTDDTLKEYRDKSERVFILRRLEENNFNMTKTAKQLGISRRQLFNLTEKYNIHR